MELEEKRAKLQDDALGLFAAAAEMANNGSSEKEIEAKIEEANELVAESERLGPLVEKERRKRNLKVKLQVLSMVLLFVAVIGFFILRILNS